MKRVLWGALTGLIMGTALAAWVVAPTFFDDPSARELGPPPVVMAVVYVMGGVVGGSIAGAFSYLVGNWAGAALLGWLCLFPIVLAFVLLEGATGQQALVDAITVSAVLGLPLGVVGRKLVLEIDPFGPIER